MGCSFVSYGLEVCVIQVLDSAKWPMIVIGSSCLQRTDGPGILSSTLSLAKRLTSRSSLDSNCRVFNVLQRVRHSRDDECLLGFSKTASYLLPVSLPTVHLYVDVILSFLLIFDILILVFSFVSRNSWR